MGITPIALKGETKAYERRSPLTPARVGVIVSQLNQPMVVEASDTRIFPNSEFQEAGATVVEKLGPEHPFVLGVKEIPEGAILPGVAYGVFNHVADGQQYNMAMLQRMIDSGVTLFDHEYVTDDDGNRVVAFGEYAGMAGIIDSFCALGQRLDALWCRENPFAHLLQTIHYDGNLSLVQEILESVAAKIRRDGMPRYASPFVVGFIGAGRVARGAWKVFDAMKPRTITPEELLSSYHLLSAREVYKVVLEERHTVGLTDGDGSDFDLRHYRANPSLYTSLVGKYLDHITVLVNCILWNKGQPQLVTREDLLQQSRNPIVIGDIGCDPGEDGPIAATLIETDIGNPFFVYNPIKNEANLGVRGPGHLVYAVSNAPTQLPLQASEGFDRQLFPLIRRMVEAGNILQISSWPPELQRAVILDQGQLVGQFADNPHIRSGLASLLG